MVRLELSTWHATQDEVHARELCDELEWIEMLLQCERDGKDIVEAAREMTSYQREQGKEPWQSVIAFRTQHAADAREILEHPVIQRLRRGFEKRFDPLYRLQVGRRPDDVEVFEQDIHDHMWHVTHGIAELKYLANEKRGGGMPMSLADARACVHTSVVSRVYEPSRFVGEQPMLCGMVVASTAPTVDVHGDLHFEKKNTLGLLSTGPAFDFDAAA